MMPRCLAFALLLLSATSAAQFAERQYTTADPDEGRYTIRAPAWPGWYLKDPDYIPELIIIARVDNDADLERLCNRPWGQTWAGCVLREGPICKIYLGPGGTTNCFFRHELKHCAGWNHVYENRACD
jgi:hypothetical protein